MASFRIDAYNTFVMTSTTREIFWVIIYLHAKFELFNTSELGVR